MKYKICGVLNKKRGFMIIESLVYIFLTTLILIEGISLFVSMYKFYVESRNISVEYNNIRNFYINIDNILTDGNIEEIIAEDNHIVISKDSNYYNSNKVIKSYDGNIVVKYTEGKSVKTINTMLTDINELRIKKKGKLIYLIIDDKYGKEFIRCI